MLFFAGVLGGCDRVEELPWVEPPSTPHEAYARALEQAGLHETALGREWLGAARAALQTPVAVTLPVQETGYLPVERPRAVSYRVNLVRGRKLSLQADLTPHPGALVFIDVYAVPENPADGLRHELAADSGARSLEFEPRRTGDYVIRLQPELLRGGRFSLTMRVHPSLSFPVLQRGNDAIQSGFGAPRDGGARDHHGIDIFAPRGTPALAAARAVVTRVQETARGGRVVWLHDERRGTRLYYAHLDRQLVQPGDVVEIGDTVGLIGNTGNARSTPPHLHFGIYRRGEGSLDPWPWVARINARLPALTGDTALIGSWAVARRETEIRSAAGLGSTQSALTRETIVRVLGAQGDWYQVGLPDGRIGYVPAADVVAAQPTPIPLGKNVELRALPAAGAALIDTLRTNRVDVYGHFGEYTLVRADSTIGWIRTQR